MKHKTFVDLYTPEGENLIGQPWQSYPRPQLRRDSFLNLNGVWEFTISAGAELPESYDRKILVPFAPETLLSGLHIHCPEGNYLFYRRTFTLPDGFMKKRLILHVGAADQVADVWLNGVHLGSHVGGYEHFSFDLTGRLEAENTLVIRTVDHMSRLKLPYGKQSKKRGGMWYTPTSGIWQTVWLESVPANYIRSLKIQNGADWVEVQAEGAASGIVTIQTPEGDMVCDLKSGAARAEFTRPRLWSPEDPYLYQFRIDTETDHVESYFALRTLTIERVDGRSRLCLNGKPYFFHGLLDQGYWSDGLLTPADASCFERDILTMKSLGFNMLRKHIKVEPEEFYYACDRLGMVVFQDMVNNGKYHYIQDTVLPTLGFKRRGDKRLHRDPETRKCFLDAMGATVKQLENHPCICYWTIFNEGWGQFDGTNVYHRLKELDSSRFIDTNSGWYFGCESDVVSEHIYFRPFKVYATDKPLVLSEFGGYTYTPRGHAYHPDKEYGYRHFDDREEYERALLEMYERDIVPAVAQGLCAAVYTQVSDVEDETNGLLSFDRKVTKLSPEGMLALAEKLRIK